MLWRVRSPASRLKPPAEFILPSQPTRSAVAPAGPGWIHEVKHDGYRLIARKDGDRVQLWTRQAIDYTDRFTAIAAAVRGLPVQSCMIDGEAVAYADAAYDFHALRSGAAQRTAQLIAFDLLQLDGADLRELPVEERRRRLKALLTGRGRPAMMFSAEIDGDGPEIFAHACALGLEGIVSKRRGSRYTSGRTWDWIKTKNPAFERPDARRA